MKRGLTELEIKFEISRDLGREELHEYDAKKKTDNLEYINKVIGRFTMPISEKIGLQLIV